MKLTTVTVTTVVEKDLCGSYLVVTEEPKNASVYIDDELITVTDGELVVMLPYGNHAYRAEVSDFMPQAGVVEIGRECKEKNIKLASAQAVLSLSCADGEAEHYINDRQVGKASWNGRLDAGMYVVEARKEGHRPDCSYFSLGLRLALY